MKTKSIEGVRVNVEQGLYVIDCGAGYSCLGFQVCLDRIARLAKELGEEVSPGPPGDIGNYTLLEDLQEKAYKIHRNTGRRFECELTPQLKGLEHRLVEVEDEFGEVRKFRVGRSTGWIPVHLEIGKLSDSGGVAASRRYKRVTPLENNETIVP